MKIKYGLYDGAGDAITSATTLKAKIKRDADDYFYDWNDSTFKASGHSTLDSALAEPDATNAPGEYEISVDESGWDDGTYTVYCNYTGTPKQNGFGEVIVADGAEVTDISPAAVNSEVVDAINTDTYAEPGQEAPGATITLAAKISYLYKAWRNKKDNDGTTRNLYNDDAATVDQKSDVDETAGTVTTAEWESGP